MIRDHNFPESTGEMIDRYKCTHPDRTLYCCPLPTHARIPKASHNGDHSRNPTKLILQVALNRQHHVIHPWPRQLAYRVHHPGPSPRQCCPLSRYHCTKHLCTEQHCTELQSQIHLNSQNHRDPRSPPRRPSSRQASKCLSNQPRPSSRRSSKCIPKHHCTELQSQIKLYSQDHSDPRSSPRPSRRQATVRKPKQDCTEMQGQVQSYCQCRQCYQQCRRLYC